VSERADISECPAPSRTLGVAIEIPAPYGPELDAIRMTYAPGAVEMPAHVTILAPFDVDPEVMPSVIDHMTRVAAASQPFRLVLQGSGSFRPVSPVVFVAVADGIAGCEGLERRVRSGALGVESRFPYHPHVTIAHDVEPDVLDRAFDDLSGYRAAMQIDAMSLHENVEGTWQLVQSFPFGSA
jgi:2'-5' RNA ligase